MPDAVEITIAVAALVGCLDALITKRLPPLVPRVLLLLLGASIVVQALD